MIAERRVGAGGSRRVYQIVLRQDDEVGAGNLVVENLLDRIVMIERLIFRALGGKGFHVIGNAAFDAALAFNNCTSNVFTPAGAASDARVMRSVLPLSVRTALRNAQSSLPTSTTTARTYTVQPGDSLMRIAQRLLGSPANFRMLIAANPSLAAHPNLIHPGQVLVIPG